MPARHSGCRQQLWHRPDCAVQPRAHWLHTPVHQSRVPVLVLRQNEVRAPVETARAFRTLVFMSEVLPELNAIQLRRMRS
ncbi:MAG TPA: hypothetical protein VFV38_09315 [Ktedonobacteraceae bacterium]|nr:hypothetical protein [Ktedonobacteraceae bacterium]